MTLLESNVMHKYKTNKLTMEDLWIGVDIPDDPKTRKIKKIRDRITFKEESKRKLLENGFISKVKFDCGKSEIAVNCEILCILSGLFCNESREESKDTQNLHLNMNIFKNERLQLLNIISQIINHLSTLVYPFTRHDISILRSLKNIILNLKYEINPQEIQFFIDLLLLHKNTPSVYALKNEIINLFTGILKYKDIRDKISSKKVIYILNNPNLNTISLLNLLISPSTYQWIKINHVFNSKNKAFSLVVKWFLYGEGKDFKTVIDFFTEYIFVDKTSLYFFGQVVHENIEAQVYARECGLLEKICNRYDQEVDEGVVYVITNLVDTFESNRKYVAESNVLPQVFEIFKMRCLRKEYDGIFKEILQFFQVMTRSVLFLRTHLLDYPIIELLFDVLTNCENQNEELDGDWKEVNDLQMPNISNQMPNNSHQQSNNLYQQSNNPNQQSINPYLHNPYYAPSNFKKSVLKLIVNLVLDYGNYKKKFVENGGFDKILRHKQTHPVEVLMIFKNFLYDTHWQAKEQFLSSTNPDFLNFFFEIYETSKDLCVIEILFNLIRNLVCDDSLELILVTYTDLIPKIFKYLAQFSEEKNEKVLIQILYTIGNLSANSPAFRDLIFEGKRMDCLKRSCTTRDLSLAFVWIIINVSWKDNGYEERVYKLREFGIKEFLLKMTSGDSVLMDKINTALDNIK